MLLLASEPFESWPSLPDPLPLESESLISEELLPEMFVSELEPSELFVLEAIESTVWLTKPPELSWFGFKSVSFELVPLRLSASPFLLV